MVGWWWGGGDLKRLLAVQPLARNYVQSAERRRAARHNGGGRAEHPGVRRRGRSRVCSCVLRSPENTAAAHFPCN